MLRYAIEEKILMIPLVIKSFFINILSKKNDYKTYKYGDNIKQYYRVFQGEESKPTIVFIHGGGWWHGSPKTSSSIGKFFNDLGYTVVIPAYRLVPLYKYPTQINDVFEAVKDYLSKVENVNNIIVMGFSAGAELSTNLVFNLDKQKEYNIDKDRFKGLISISGVLDFDKCTSNYSKILIDNYIGYQNDRNSINPINLINKDTNIDVLCIHGNKDPLINIENSISFVDKINSFNGNARLAVIKGKHHSDIVSLFLNKGEKGSKEILDFIEGYGENKK
ncbi:alpha/beta hydrolase [Clostridium sp. AL.422]|uniref:alpha/beta hydrolase n=1 Tax=Clostridium TaxID=1485 RepID=UPI00293DF4CC|nr:MULTISPECIES: alpha/beta hydrolase [unclassified Clostridium]MDV4150051.1 alpha/beta hydrolase [Clostridium sp. AL.422]